MQLTQANALIILTLGFVFAAFILPLLFAGIQSKNKDIAGADESCRKIWGIGSLTKVLQYWTKLYLKGSDCYEQFSSQPQPPSETKQIVPLLPGQKTSRFREIDEIAQKPGKGMEERPSFACGSLQPPPPYCHITNVGFVNCQQKVITQG